MVTNSDSPLHRVVGLFSEEFVYNTTTRTLRELIGREPVSLADYIEAWMRSGEGVRACRDTHTFMIAIPVIVDIWYGDPDMLAYISNDMDPVTGRYPTVHRRVDEFLGPLGYGHPILDPGFFRQCAEALG